MRNLLCVIYLFISSAILGSGALSKIDHSTTANEELKKIKEAILSSGVNWTAGENWVSRLSSEQRKQLGGALLEPPEFNETKMISIPKSDQLPAQFDWRNNGGNWLTPVKRQGDCGCCWNFSAVAQVESWWKIKNALPDSMIDLSEQYVLSCSNGNCGEGWGIGGALKFIEKYGIPPESCMEYQASDTIPCGTACEDWQEYAVTIPGFGYITSIDASTENIKNAVYRHPVSATYKIYDDFTFYQSGVYEYVWGEEVCGHAVLIVGWNDQDQSWICKNSWGPQWGESGYFRIKWANCEIGRNIPFIWDTLTGEDALTVTPNEFNTAVTSGDSIIEYITVKNLGNDNLEFSSKFFSIVPSGIKKPGWLNISNGSGVLQPGDSTFVNIIVRTGHLEANNYQCIIKFCSNDTSCSEVTIPYNLEVYQADFDIGINRIHLPADSVSIFTQIVPQIEIKNCGINDVTDFDLTCTALCDDYLLYEETIHIPIILSGHTDVINFKPYSAIKTGCLDFVIQICDCHLDYNPINNIMCCSIYVTNQIDGFEQATDLWDFKGGWGIVDQQSHGGSHAVHINNGQSPYENNMNAKMTYKTGFNYYSVERSMFSYWTKYDTEINKDICFLEVSADSINWIKIDSISGSSLNWEQHKVFLPDFANSTVWTRFRFISDSQNTMYGVLIDDIEIYPIATDIFSDKLTDKIPKYCSLEQNYPNPFNSSTKIKFALPNSATVKIEVYNIIGQKIAILLNEHMATGHHEIELNGQNLSSGTYLYRIQAGQFNDVRKMVLVR